MHKMPTKKQITKTSTNDNIKKFLNRPLSWSSINQFKYDPEIWYEKYINGKRQRPTGPIVFGKNVGERLATEKDFLPQVPRLKVYEQELKCKILGIPCIGYLDNFDLETKSFSEFKTGKKWTLEIAKSHGQIDMYCAMIWQIYNIPPEELTIKLIWMPTEEKQDFTTYFVKDMKPVIYHLNKTMVDVLKIMRDIKDIHQEMQEYIIAVDNKQLQQSTASVTL